MLKSDNTVWAWGFNGDGRLGNGTNFNSSAPVQVSGLANVLAVGAGATYSFAVKSNGSAWAWGANSVGQLGDGSNLNRNAPVPISGLAGVAAIVGGDDQALAVKSNGTAWGWGWNGNAELGDGTKDNRNAPVQVSGLARVRAVASGDYHSLAIVADNSAPVANDDPYSTDENVPLVVATPGVLGNDTDGDNDPLTAALLNNATSGTLTLNTNGSFDYTPNVGFTGTDTFTYEASDGTATSSAATVTITVNTEPTPVPGVSAPGLAMMATLLLVAFSWGYRRYRQGLRESGLSAPSPPT